ncbi:MAG: thioredoxin family protein [Muribaculaceae bacterium]|nr:thioredoxin family protein [Muribaculaceae bacterium]MBP3639714.1 thioredoxin family protein [Muribaculaceae bacterium]
MDYQDFINKTETMLVEFYASWCPHCQRMMPVVAEVKELLGGMAGVYQFDIDKNQQAAQEAGVESVPTFIIYRNGKELWRHTGEIDGQVLLETVQRCMAPRTDEY